MVKKIICLAGTLITCLGLFTGCESINRVTVNHESLIELQTVLPDLYYFDFDSVLESDDPDVDLAYEAIKVMEPVEFKSQAILTQNTSGKKYEYFGYRIVYNLSVNSEIAMLSIVGFKHNSRDFVVSSSRISSEYKDAVQRKDFIEERTIDGIQCVIYGNKTAFFWTNEQQYTIVMHQAIEQGSFTINDFISIIESAIMKRYKI